MTHDTASTMTRPSPARVLVIGLDMGDGSLIRHWSRQGRLPHFAALSASGTWLTLESTARALHTSTWPTFATGALPGRHGVYYPYQPKPGHQLAQHIGAHQYGAPTFWQLADSQERRCLVYDIPETFPTPGFHGRAIFDWGTWAWYGKPEAQPTAILNDLKRRFGAYPLGLEAKRLGLRSPDATTLAERLLRSVEYKSSTAQWLLECEAWDLAVLGFCELHPAGHYLWPDGADTIDAADEAVFQPLLNTYAAIDRALGTICDRLPESTAVVVVSGDGVGPNRCGWHLLPMVLERLGYSYPTASSSTRGHLSSAPALLGRAKDLLSPSTKRWIIDRLPWRLRDRLGAQIQSAAIDWSRTRAFTLPTDLEGCIRINLQGREPQGIVEPGAQYADLCQEIRARLEELTNPATGTRAVRNVWVRNEIFPGDRQEHLPDLIITWNDARPFEALASPHLGLVEGLSPDPRPGTHSPTGFLLAAGAGIPRGHQVDGHLMDVAPTVLGLLGLEPPPTMDGRPLTALSVADVRPVPRAHARS